MAINPKFLQSLGMCALALVAGIIVPFSLAPYNIWLLGIIGPCTLAILLRNKSGKQSILYSFIFGLGLYGAGVYWVYGAIHDFGYTAAPLAVVMTVLFVTFLAIVFALPFYIYGRFVSTTVLGYAFGFAAIWCLGEWTRTWFLTGFPWLFVGYAHVNTWLAGWAPLFGVLGVSFIAIASGTVATVIIVDCLRFINPQKSAQMIRLFIFLLLFIGCWGGGYALYGNSWKTHPEKTISAAIVQPNIPLEVKWNPLYRGFTLDILREHTEPHWNKDLIVWPEAAVPIMYNEAGDFLDEISDLASEHNSAVITGILYDDEKPRTYYNAITGLGNASGLYFKKRLVPFGEYVPLENLLRGLIRFFDLPNSIIQAGPWEQEILQLGDYKISPSICYEIVYPDLVSDMAKDAQLLITISNDAWFGDSIGPKQHFQMAQMRALENHRYVIRSTNTGISGFIDPLGQVSLLGKQFNRESISHSVGLISGYTPYMWWGNFPVLFFAFSISILSCFPLVLRQQRSVVHLPD